MATWKSENSMLTERGIEILNKIKAGIGVITITRVVAGSGRVTESQLYTQTSISGVQKDMVLSKKNVHNGGSELFIYITNNEFTESFTLNQIGVYVTHPDYVGEQLYHISQCESGTQDVIPTPELNPSSLIYSLFLEHGNESSIQITVDPQGMVSREEFDNFFKNVVPGNLFTIDENRNVVDTGVPASMLGSSSKNLLHNWYLKSPVDTRRGNIAEVGTVYYSDTLMTEQAGTLTSAHTAIHVSGNNYCTIIIDDEEYYVSAYDTSVGYLANDDEYPCIDRWVLSGSGRMGISEKGASLILSPGGRFFQDVATVTYPEYYGGHTYTFSAKIEDVYDGTPVLILDNGKEVLETEIRGVGLVSLTVFIPEDAESLVVGIKNKHDTRTCNIEISAVKLEVGGKSTLETDPPADYAEQMAICFQYDPDYGYYRGLPMLGNTLATAVVVEE